MTTIATARAALYQKYFDDVTAIPTSRLTFENEAFDPPDDLSWCRLAVRLFGGGQESLGDVGARKFNREGLVFVQVFLPQDNGVAEADTIAQEVRDIFEGTTISGVRLFDTEIREVGLTDGYHMTIAETAFEYTETR